MFAPPMPSWWPWLLRWRLVAGGLLMVAGLGVAARGSFGSLTAFAAGCGLGLAALVVITVIRGPGRVDALVAWALREGRPPPGLPPALVDAEARRRRPSRWSVWSGPAFAVLGPVGIGVLFGVRGPGGPPLAVPVVLGAVCIVSGYTDWLSVREATRWIGRTTREDPVSGVRL